MKLTSLCSMLRQLIFHWATRRTLACWSCSWVGLISMNSTAMALDTIWTGAVDNNWQEAGNWSAGLPSIGTIGDAIINNGDAVILDSNLPTAPSAFNVDISGSSDLTVSGGADLRALFLRVGFGSAGTMTVTGAGTTLTTTSPRQDITIGLGGIGTLNIADAAIVTTNPDEGYLGVGFQTAGSSLNLLGTDGSRGVLGTNSIGANSSASISVNFDGGVLRALHSGISLIANTAGTNVTINPGGAFIDTNGFDVAIDRPMGGTGALTKEGTGTLTLGGANTYTGGTTVSDGTLAVTGSIHHPNSNLAVSGMLKISGSGSVTNLTGSLGADSAGRAEVSGGTWTNSGNLFIGVAHDSTLEMTGGNVSANTVALGSLFSQAAKGTLQLRGGTLTATQVAEAVSEGFVEFGGGTLRLSANQSDLFGSFESGDVTLAAGGGTIDTQGFTVASNYGLSGVGGLTKVGSGILTLTGANSYTGSTQIEAGTLSLGTSGSLADSLGIDIAAGATFDVSGLAGGFTLGGSQTLSGNGTILGNVTTTGTLAPGNSTGELQFTGDLQLDSAAMLEMELASLSDFDRVLVDGMLIYGGTLTLSFLDGYLPTDGDSFDLFDGFTSHSGSFDDITMPVAGFAAHLDYATGQLTFTAVPEPKTLGFLGLATCGLLLIRRRQFRVSGNTVPLP